MRYSSFAIRHSEILFVVAGFIMDRPKKVLIIEPDSHVVEIIVDGLVQQFGAQVTCVSNGTDGLDVDMLQPHDVVIASLNTVDMDGLELASQLAAISPRPVILVANHLNVSVVLEAMKLGVRDLLTKPFPLQNLLDAVERAAAGYTLRRTHQVRYHQMRNMVRRLLGERKRLNERLDLICRDLVSAHRRLVNRVIQYEQTSSPK